MMRNVTIKAKEADHGRHLLILFKDYFITAGLSQDSSGFAINRAS